MTGSKNYSYTVSGRLFRTVTLFEDDIFQRGVTNTIIKPARILARILGRIPNPSEDSSLR